MSAIRISVVVPTRNREKDAEACVRSILANERDDFELVVVDQSDRDATENALRPLLLGTRFRYLRSDARGVSRSRNAGLAATTAPVVAFTDDDCVVDKDWIARLSEVFEANADAALVFGRVTVPSNVDGIHRYAAQFAPETREYQHAFPSARVQWGIGANMAIRRSAFDRIGGFDPFLGPGARFPAAEEYDLAIRAIAAGMKIVNASEVSVLHLGVREGGVASALVRGYGVAIGAALAKHVRLGTKDGALLLARWLGYHGATAARNVVTGKRPTNVRFVAGMVRGIVTSWSQPLDGPRFVYGEGGESESPTESQSEN